MLEIFLVRHAETDFNKRKLVQGRTIDSSINEKGEQQSKLLAEALMGVDFDAVYCSNLQRTSETLQPYLKRQPDMELIEDGSLDEISWGIHEGCTPSKKMKKEFNQMLNDWASGQTDEKVPEGESAKDCLLRIDTFLDEQLNEAEGRYLICTHGWMLKFFLHRLLSMSLADLKHYRVPNTGVYILQKEKTEWLLKDQIPDLHLKKESV